MKKYDFSFHLTPGDTNFIPSRASAFTSYPGTIFSADDFYIQSSGLVVQETTNEVWDDSLWKNVKSDKIVYEFIRNLVANRLAKSGKEWTEIFAKYNSGTYNNQFMIIDYNKFKNGTQLQKLPDGLLWVIEQIPGMTKAADVTEVVRKQGYWASYNLPYFKEISGIF